MTAPDAIRLDDADNVATAVRTLQPGDTVLGVTLSERVARGHKLALAAIAAGQPVVKYGQFIGHASVDIAPGSHVHSHNLAFAATAAEYEFSTNVKPVQDVGDTARASFDGFRRPSGRVGTRNHVAVSHR
jgi:altronate hydrolase